MISSKSKLDKLWLSRIAALIEYSNNESNINNNSSNNTNRSSSSTSFSVLATPIDSSCAGEDDALSEHLSKLEQVIFSELTVNYHYHFII